MEKGRLLSQIEELKRELARRNQGNIPKSRASRQPSIKPVVISDDEGDDLAQDNLGPSTVDTTSITRIKNNKRVRSISPDVEIIEVGPVDNELSSLLKRRRVLSPELAPVNGSRADAAHFGNTDIIEKPLSSFTATPGADRDTNGILPHKKFTRLCQATPPYTPSQAREESHDVGESPNVEQQQGQQDYLSSLNSDRDGTIDCGSRSAFPASSTSDVLPHIDRHATATEKDSAPVTKSIFNGVSPQGSATAGGLAHLFLETEHVIGDSPAVIKHTKDELKNPVHAPFIGASSAPTPSSSSSSIAAAALSYSHSPLLSYSPFTSSLPPTVDRDAEMIPAPNVIRELLALPIPTISSDVVDGIKHENRVPEQPVSFAVMSLSSEYPNQQAHDSSNHADSSKHGKNEDREAPTTTTSVKSSLHGDNPHSTAKVKGKKRSPQTSRLSSVPTILALDPLWVEAVAGFLHDTPALIINPDPDMNFRVPRALLGQKYKISTGSFQAIVKAHLNPSSTPNNPLVRSILFPFYDQNPDLPAKPGDPGIILTKRTDILEIQPATIFINYDGRGKTPSVWLYAGEYTLKKCAEMTGEQFSRQPVKTQERWGRTIITLKRDNVWAQMRARIYLRKHNMPLTHENIKTECDKIQAVKGNPGVLDVQDVIDAFIRGDECLDIIHMQCVAYDRTFLEDLRSNKAASTVTDSDSKVVQPTIKSKMKSRMKGSTKRQGIAAGSAPEGSAPGLRRSARERKPSGRTFLEADPDPDVHLDGSMSDLTNSDYLYSSGEEGEG
ncbi:protein [Lentinula edodes]|uniref:Protein n=1 Tax=Lentinula edodes TaxID=5353 RepID=A0A1Q3ESG1_LENED|nr:protein [Lentinula edodes]